MVPILSSSEKPITNGHSTLALFGSWLVSPEDRRATDITLNGHDPVLPGAAKITLIIPKGGLEGMSLWDPELAWSPRPLEWCNNCFNFPLRRVGPNDPTNSYNLLWYAYDPDGIGNRGYSFTFRDFPPFYWVVWRRVHSWFFLILNAPAFGRLHRQPECCLTLIDLRNPFSASCCCIGLTWNPSFPEG